MMQLLCNGVRLDLYDNVELQFKHSNPIFAFDKLECERTTEFKLPATPTNDRVFGLCRIPAYSGAGMMARFAAELQVGTLVRTGYLYVSKFDKEYSAILITGEMVKLQAAKLAGKISDYIQDITAPYGQITEFSHTTIYQTLRYGNALQTNTHGGSGSEYFCEDSICRPRLNIWLLAVNTTYQTFGINMDVPNDLRDIVYVSPNCLDANGEAIQVPGTQVNLKYNIPDWTAVDLVKILAYAGGYSLNYEDGTLSFLNSTTQLGSVVDITKRLTKRGEVARTILDFAQNDFINYKDEDTYNLQKHRANYTINNANLETEKNLYTLPAQPSTTCNIYGVTGLVALLWDENSKNYYITNRPIHPLGSEWLAREVFGEYYLRPFDTYENIPINPLVKAVTDAATQIKVEARMTMLEYYAIKNTSIIQVDNTQYVWLERSWQKNTAQFTLARI